MQTVVAWSSFTAETQKICVDVKHLNQITDTSRGAKNRAPIQLTFTTALMLEDLSVARAEGERSSMKDVYAPEAKFTAVNRNGTRTERLSDPVGMRWERRTKRGRAVGAQSRCSQL